MSNDIPRAKNPKVTELRPRTQVQPKVEDEPAPIMVRDLDGRIYFWNSSAEDKYGWSHRDAIGNVSHSLLRTIFPEPLDVINYELLNRGAWEGLLIHTRADGSQVKVSSRWQLFQDADGRLCTVLEVNDRFLPVDPASAHLQMTPIQRLRHFFNFLIDRKWWWVVPSVALLAVTALIWVLTHHPVLPPRP